MLHKSGALKWREMTKSKYSGKKMQNMIKGTNQSSSKENTKKKKIET